MKTKRVNKVDRLSSEGRTLVRSMLGSTDPYHTLREVQDALKEATGEDLSLNTIARERDHVAESLRRLEDRAVTKQVLTDQTAKALNLDATGASLVRNVLGVAMMAGEEDLHKADPVEIAKLVVANRKVDLDQKKVEVTEANYRAQIDDLKVQLAAAKKAASAGGGGPAPAALFHRVAKIVLGILGTFQELRPLLQKYSTNIAKRLSTEAERFSIEEAA
jgi:hypothetical protein